MVLLGIDLPIPPQFLFLDRFDGSYVVCYHRGLDGEEGYYEVFDNSPSDADSPVIIG